jgi:hypothetical protein
MKVFKCMSCGRLLFRPDELLGRAWHCLTCGPTVVSEEPVIVTAELAALLEKEYQLSLSFPPMMVIGAPAVAVHPPDDKPVVFGRNIKTDNQHANPGAVVVSLSALVIGVLWLGYSAFTARNLEEFISWLVLGIAFGSPIFTLCYVLSTLIGNARYRSRMLKAVAANQNTTRAPTRGSDYCNDSVSPEPHGKTESSFHDQHGNETPSSEPTP